MVPKESCELNPREVCIDVVKQYPTLVMDTDCQVLPRETCSPERVQPKEVTRPIIKKVCTEKQAENLIPEENPVEPNEPTEAPEGNPVKPDKPINAPPEENPIESNKPINVPPEGNPVESNKPINAPPEKNPVESNKPIDPPLEQNRVEPNEPTEELPEVNFLGFIMIIFLHIYFVFQDKQIYLQVLDEFENPIKGAFIRELHLGVNKIKLQNFTDEYGLALLGEFPAGQEFVGVVEHSKYETLIFQTVVPTEGKIFKVSMKKAPVPRRSKIGYF